jgi:hypothetical protein
MIRGFRQPAVRTDGLGTNMQGLAYQEVAGCQIMHHHTKQGFGCAEDGDAVLAWSGFLE